MGIVLSHRDRIWIEVKAASVVWLCIGMVIDDIDRIIVVDQRLHALSAYQCRSGADTEVAAVGGSR